MGSFGQLGQQSSGSLGSSLSLGNSGLPINSPSQSVYHTNYGLNSIGKLRTLTQEITVRSTTFEGGEKSRYTLPNVLIKAEITLALKKKWTL